MLSIPLGITEATFEKNVSQWLRIVRFNESGLVIKPVGDHFYTIPYLLTNKKVLKGIFGRYYNRYILVYEELSPSSTIETLKQVLLKACHKRSVEVDDTKPFTDIINGLVDAGYEVAFFLARVEDHFIQQAPLMTELEVLSRQHRMSVIYFAEQNLTNQQFFAQQRRYPTMFQNIIYLPFYEREDALCFISYNEKLWDFVVPEDVKEQIITMCGGNLWFIRQTLRYYRNTGDTEQLFTHDEIIRKVVASYNQLFPDEQETLHAIVIEKKRHIPNAFARDFLLRVHILEEENGTYRLAIPLLEHCMQQEQAVDALSVRKNIIYKADTIIDSVFTEKEKKLLIYLLQKRHSAVTRERLGKLLAEKNTSYSDWALDQLVSRLRTKLVKLGFPSQIIKTKKGVGYVLS